MLYEVITLQSGGSGQVGETAGGGDHEEALPGPRQAGDDRNNFV